MRVMPEMKSTPGETPAPSQPNPAKPAAPSPADKIPPEKKVAEIGGFKGPEPTRYGDWEYNGRCTDF